MLLFSSVTIIKNLILNFLIKLFLISKLLIKFFIDVFELFIKILIIFCNLALIFYNLFALFSHLSLLIDHIYRYENLQPLKMIRTFFSRLDFFLLTIFFLTFLSSLIMTICKCVKKAIVTFALATTLLILFIEEYYNKHKPSH